MHVPESRCRNSVVGPIEGGKTIALSRRSADRRIGAGLFRAFIGVSLCAFAVACDSSSRDARRRDCEVWQGGRQIEVLPFCNNVQFLMVHIRLDAHPSDTTGLVGRVVTWTRTGPSNGPWQTVPEWFVAPERGASQGLPAVEVNDEVFTGL